jgi:hypothetical protein
MATVQTPAVKTPKIKKAPVAAVTRLVDQMKRGALQGKLTATELDTIANLAASLKVFVSV